jgi:hypothetical protein
MKRHLTVAVALALCGMTTAAAAQQGFQSSAPAAELIAALQERKLEAISARDPDQPGAFVAALYVPASQLLLVVSGPHSVPAAIDKYIADRKHMDTYLALNGAEGKPGRFFVMDVNADGLHRDCAPGESFDSTLRNGSNQVSFDGNWRAQGVTAAGYDGRFAEDDGAYARLLQVLAASLTGTSPHPPAAATGR